MWSSVQMRTKIVTGLAILATTLLAVGLIGGAGHFPAGDDPQYIVGPAWSTADGAMETTIQIEAQMILVDRILDSRDGTQYLAAVNEARTAAREALERVANAGIIPEQQVRRSLSCISAMGLLAKTPRGPSDVYLRQAEVRSEYREIRSVSAPFGRGNRRRCGRGNRARSRSLSLGIRVLGTVGPLRMAAWSPISGCSGSCTILSSCWRRTPPVWRRTCQGCAVPGRGRQWDVCHRPVQ